MTRARGRAVQALLGVPLLALALAGCTDEPAPEVVVPSGTPTPAPSASSPPTTGGAPEPSGSATPASSTPPPADDAGVEVVAEPPEDPTARAVFDAYVAFWTEDVAVLADPARPLGTLEALTAEPQRQRTLAFVAAQRAEGLAYRGTVVLDPQVAGTPTDVVVLTDCLDDSGLVAVDADGAAAEGTGGARVAYDAVLTAEDGRWQVSDLRASEGDAGCG